MNFTETFQKTFFAPKWDFFALFENAEKKDIQPPFFTKKWFFAHIRAKTEIFRHLQKKVVFDLSADKWGGVVAY